MHLYYASPVEPSILWTGPHLQVQSVEMVLNVLAPTR